MTRTTRERRLRLAQLRTLEIFADCSDEQLRLVDMLGAEIGLAAGRRITLTSPRGMQLCIVRQGVVTTLNADGCTAHLAGSVVPPVADAMRGTPTTLVALEPARLIVYDCAESRHLLLALPQLAAVQAEQRSTVAGDPRNRRQSISAALLG